MNNPMDIDDAIVGQKRKACDSDVEDESDDEVFLMPREPVKKKRRMCKFSTCCKRLGIPCPTIHDREVEHMDSCIDCQALWPLYLYQQHYEQKRPLVEISEAWLQMKETDRKRKLAILTREEQLWIKKMIHSRAPTGYQVFLKEKREESTEMKKIKFTERTKIIARLWQSMPESTRAIYHQKSLDHKKERDQYLANLPPFKRKLLEKERKLYKKDRKAKQLAKPTNPFLLYLTDQWRKEKEKEGGTALSYNDVMTIAARTWKTLNEKEKQPYEMKFVQEKEAYFIAKERLKQQTKHGRKRQKKPVSDHELL